MYCEKLENVVFDQKLLNEYLDSLLSRLTYNVKDVAIIDLINYSGGDVLSKPSEQKNWSTWMDIPEFKRSRPGWAVIDRERDRTIVDLEECKALGILHQSLFQERTSAFFGYIENVCQSLSHRGIQLTHTWLACFAPGRGYTRHYHAARHDYFRVLHVPIRTDPSIKMRFFSDCDVEGELPLEEHHLSQGDCFLIDGSVVHDVINVSDRERWHMCSIVYDLKDNFSLGKGGSEAFASHRHQAEIWRNYVANGQGSRFLDWK